LSITLEKERKIKYSTDKSSIISKITPTFGKSLKMLLAFQDRIEFFLGVRRDGDGNSLCVGIPETSDRVERCRDRIEPKARFL